MQLYTGMYVDTHWQWLQRDVAHEIEENQAEQERLQGSSLVYGEKVQVSISLYNATTVILFDWECFVDLHVSAAVPYSKQEIFSSEHN